MTMEDYLMYKQWWYLVHLYDEDWWLHNSELSQDDAFIKHINSMTTYELMETLANWGD
jgi:hypothetical protein